jgi:serine/threonine protein kinase, bacterial
VDGAALGRYRLIELLGRGGMGEVWRAHDTVIDRTVAIKTLLPHFAQDKTFEQRFRREARAAARLDDPHVVPIYDVGEINGRLYVAMRLINGTDLKTLLDAGPLAPDRAVRITEQVALALHAAHKVGLVHRDVKRSNVLIADYDFAYLIDFGIARAAGETGLTSTGATIGTWSYMAPERFSRGKLNPAPISMRWRACSTNPSLVSCPSTAPPLSKLRWHTWSPRPQRPLHSVTASPPQWTT